MSERIQMTGEQIGRADAMERLEGALLTRLSPKFDLTSWVLNARLRPERYKHRFGDRIYIREIEIDALPMGGTLALGHLHKTDHWNAVLEGRVLALVDGQVREFRSGSLFLSKGGERKLVRVLEDCRWINIFPNPDNCQDIEELERRLIDKSATFTAYEDQAKHLMEGEL